MKKNWVYLSSHPWICFFLFFVVPYWLFAWITYPTFGVTIDEPYLRMLGDHLKDFLAHKNTSVEMWMDHAFPYNLLISFLNPKSFEQTHLYNFIFATLIFAAFFKLLLDQYQNTFLALGGPFVFVLVPNFFGWIPANEMDIPFAVVFFASLCAIYFTRNWKKLSWLRVLVLGTLFGIAIAMRVVSFALFIVLVLYDGYERAVSRKKADKQGWGKWVLFEALHSFCMLVVSQAWVVYFWPYLRSDYFHHLFDVFFQSSHLMGFSYQSRFMGEMIDNMNHLPVSYLPVWLSVTLPVFVIVFFFYSFWIFKKKIGKKREAGPYLLLSMAVLVQFALYFLVKPRLYDGIRQYLFIMPIMAAMAYMAIVEFFKAKHSLRTKWMLAVFLGLNGLNITAQMVLLHPYEYVYFNELIGGIKGADGKFETDYADAAIKEGVDWLVKNEMKDPDRVYRFGKTVEQSVTTYCFSRHPDVKVGVYPDAVDYPDLDYAFQTTKCGGTLPPLLVSKVVHTVQREGVVLLYIVKLP